MKACLVLSPSHGIKKSKAKTQCVHDVNAKKLSYKNMTRTKGHDKDTYPKLVLNRLKVMGNSTCICTHWPFSSKTNLKKLSTYMCPMCTHV